MSTLLFIYIIALNLGLIGFAYFIDKYVAMLAKRLADATVLIDNTNKDVENLQEAVILLQANAPTRRRTTTKQG
jgi:hypothetical protein